jgi:hypothetical protein
MLPFNNSRILFLCWLVLLCFAVVQAQEKTDKAQQQVTKQGVSEPKGPQAAQRRSMTMSELVCGAEVRIEQEPNDKPIAGAKTDSLGTFHFKALKNGKYKLTCKLPAEWSKKVASLKPQKLFVNFWVKGVQKEPITFGSKSGKKPLLFESPEFILDGKINSIFGKIVTSPNDYGINEEGIK